jgi:large subunit ribosomal protein L6
MSRIAKNPVVVPDKVQVTQDGQTIQVKGANGTQSHTIHGNVSVEIDGGVIRFAPRDNAKKSNALAGTTRSLLSNMIQGVTDGFERRLELRGVGYRAQVKGSVLNLTLGFSHPVDFDIPAGITIETPSQTEVVIKGADKQLVGQVAANIRGYRPPEPYKGKGVRYQGEYVAMKEAKKK